MGGVPTPDPPAPRSPAHTYNTSQCTMQHTDQMIRFYSTPQGVKSTLLPRQVQALAASGSAGSLCRIRLRSNDGACCVAKDCASGCKVRLCNTDDAWCVAEHCASGCTYCWDRLFNTVAQGAETQLHSCCATSSRLWLCCHIARNSSYSLGSQCHASFLNHCLMARLVISCFDIACSCRHLLPRSMITTVLSATPKLHRLLSMSSKPCCAAITCLYSAISRQALQSTFRRCKYLSNGIAYCASHAHQLRFGLPHRSCSSQRPMA